MIALLLLLSAFQALADAPSVESISKSITWRRLTNGARNTRHELEKTLQAIRNEPLDTPEVKRFACRYPARKRYIEKTLGLSPRLSCPSHEAWMKENHPIAITFVFTSQFIGNPASTFGHNFLRFDQARTSGLLGLSFSYFAREVPNDGFISYAFKGLFGGYEGQYDFDDYYPKVRRYGSLENRDLWEYELAFDEEERLFILEFARELSLTSQPRYLFLNRNCAYYLLGLLEIARDDLNLSEDGDRFFLTPQDAIKLIAKKGLIKKTSFRPSMRRKASDLYEGLGPRQKKLFTHVLDGKLDPFEVRDADVLSAINAVLIMQNTSENPNPKKTDLFQRATLARSKIEGDGKTMPESEPVTLNPLNGHDTSLVSLGFAQTDFVNSMQLNLRPALHTLGEFSDGILPNTQIVFLETMLRIENIDERSRLRLRQLDFIHLKSLQPQSWMNDGLSWTSQLALIPTMGSPCGDCRALRATGSFGYSVEASSGWNFFALAGPTADAFLPEKKLNGRVGANFILGTIGQMSKRWVFQFDQRLDHFAIGPFDRETIMTLNVALTWQTSTNSNVSITGIKALNLRSSEYNADDLILRFSHHF